ALRACEPPGAGFAPGVEERLPDAPARLDTIGPLKQDRVPDHAIVDERLVAAGRRRCKITLVAERHTHPTDADRRAWHLGVELQRDAFDRLDAQYQEVLRKGVGRGWWKQTG